MSNLAKIISTAFGVGYFPLAPGTMGSLAALIVYWISPEITAIQLAMIILGISALGIYTATITEREMKNKLGQERGIDPGIVVIDEVIGMLIALLFVPKTAFYLIAAFIFLITDSIRLTAKACSKISNLCAGRSLRNPGTITENIQEIKLEWLTPMYD